jgi:hypothetical protein
MRELSLHILDIVENGIRAGADFLDIRVEESGADDRLIFSVEDNGSGLPAEKAGHIDDPFITGRTTRRVGLGLSLLAAAAGRCDGAIAVESRAGKGTRVRASFRRSHIDRAPLGDMAATLAVLIAGYPHIDFRYAHRVNEKQFVLDTRDLKSELEGLSLSDPVVVHHVTESIRRSLEGLSQTRPEPPMEGPDGQTDL